MGFAPVALPSMEPEALDIPDPAEPGGIVAGKSELPSMASAITVSTSSAHCCFWVGSKRNEDPPMRITSVGTSWWRLTGLSLT